MHTTKLTRATILFLVAFATVLSFGVTQYLRSRSRLADPLHMSVVKTLLCVGSLSISRQLQAKTADFALQDFVGSYYASYVFEGGTLTINFDKSFSLKWYTDVGSPMAYTGTVAYVEKRTVPNRDLPMGMPDKLIPVKWGQRRYLVSSDELDYFCVWMTEGWEPRSKKWDIFSFGMEIGIYLSQDTRRCIKGCWNSC
jgi:hypothetical protein